MTRSLPNLPEEIMLEIFSRTPAKSVGRFKCLSKLWLKNLSTCEFINLHRTRHQQENLLLISDVRKLHTIAFPVKDETVSKELLSGLPRNWKMVLGSCNGLVLLMNDKDELFLVNPILQQQVRVPRPPSVLDSDYTDHMFGFGYDLYKDDYKILNIATYSGSNGHHTYAHVYSLKMGNWKSLRCNFSFNCPYSGTDVAAGAHVNGVIIHWLSRKDRKYPDRHDYEIRTFNFADEAFGVIPLPAHNGRFRFPAVLLSVLRGCLVLVIKLKLDAVGAWIMKKDGVHESWTNFTIGGISRDARLFKNQPMCFIGGNEVMMLGRAGSILLSNLETQESKTMVVNGARPCFRDGCVFIESLVSPSSFALVAEEKKDGTDFANNTLEAGPSQAPPGSSG